MILVYNTPYCDEFLTEETTCTNELPKETTSEIFCQKRPLLSGGTPGQATRATCRLGQCRHGGAATTVAGMWPVAPAAIGDADTLAVRFAGAPTNGADSEAM
jgi:hypothetical protein